VRRCIVVEVSPVEAEGPWQSGMAYKGFGPSVHSLDGINVAAIPSLQEQPVQSAITVPKVSFHVSLLSVPIIIVADCRTAPHCPPAQTPYRYISLSHDLLPLVSYAFAGLCVLRR
jgi:hypothetical protein